MYMYVNLFSNYIKQMLQYSIQSKRILVLSSFFRCLPLNSWTRCVYIELSFKSEGIVTFFK